MPIIPIEQTKGHEPKKPYKIPNSLKNPKKRLTLKQRKFVQAYIKHDGNATKAALEAYPVKNMLTARVIAAENLSKSNVKNEIERAMQRQGLTTDTILSYHHAIIQSGVENKERATPADALRGIELLYKLQKLVDQPQASSSYTQINYNSMSKEELLELRKKNKELASKVLDFD